VFVLVVSERLIFKQIFCV